MVIEYGVNDAGNSFPYEYSMRLIIERAKALGKVIVLTGFSRQLETLGNAKEYNEIAVRLAREYGLVFADWNAVPMARGEMFDDVHPLQPYSLRLVEQLAKALDRAAPECSGG